MHLEVKVALNFIVSYLYNKLPRRRADLFGEELERILVSRFEGHWYPEAPLRGSAFRCLHLGVPSDPLVELAAKRSGLGTQEVHANLSHSSFYLVLPGAVRLHRPQHPHQPQCPFFQHVHPIFTHRRPRVPTLRPSAHHLYNRQLRCNQIRLHEDEEERKLWNARRAPDAEGDDTLACHCFSAWADEAQTSSISMRSLTPPVSSQLSPNAKEFVFPASQRPVYFDTEAPPMASFHALPPHISFDPFSSPPPGQPLGIIGANGGISFMDKAPFVEGLGGYNLQYSGQAFQPVVLAN
ncbi:Protein Tob2 [Triplophysa tibetana]|uniref:Protein Tob2 n=1 Tax=Triplophysa tibetana TaxID=1572043 RepID=A0A5A9NB75_9TELE|nr:Protein Tob2 [Triplophysa tibetana]